MGYLVIFVVFLAVILYFFVGGVEKLWKDFGRGFCMRGSTNGQVQELYHKSGVKRIGESKHEAKARARVHLAGEGVAASWHAVGKRLGIYSYKTADVYRDIWNQVFKHAKTEFKVKDIEKLEVEHIQSYLEAKIEKGVAHSTFSQHVSAIEKLESALNGYAEGKGSGRVYDFSEGIRNTKGNAHKTLERFSGSRAYDNPRGLIEAIENPVHRLVAKIQLESGARVRECTYLNRDNIRGIKNDPVTGKEKGVFYVTRAKGGKAGDKYVSVETYKLWVH